MGMISCSFVMMIPWYPLPAKRNGNNGSFIGTPMKPIQIIISKVVPYFFVSWLSIWQPFFIISVLCFEYLSSMAVCGYLSLSRWYLFFVSLALDYVFAVSSGISKWWRYWYRDGYDVADNNAFGMMFPIENMPAIISGWLSEIIPAKWYMIAIKRLWYRTWVSSADQRVYCIKLYGCDNLSLQVLNVSNIPRLINW